MTLIGRLQNVSKLLIGFGPTDGSLPTAIEQADRAFACGGGEVHVAERRLEILVTSELLDRFGGSAPHREVRAERVTQDVQGARGFEPRASLRRHHPVSHDLW